MRIITISNLYPRPDQQQRGMFNAQLFASMERMRGQRMGDKGSNAGNLTNICLVPEWRIWRWPRIRRWRAPAAGIGGQESGVKGQGADGEGASVVQRTIYQPVFYIPVLARSLSWWSYGWTMGGLKPLARECDVVFSTWLYPDGVTATRLATACGKPAWIMVQGSDTFHLDHPFRRSVILDACNKATGIVCVWKGLAERLIAAGVDTGKVHVVPNGVDTASFFYRDAKSAGEQLAQRSGILDQTLERIGERKIVLFVGNLVSVKGPDIMLDAFASVVGHLSSVLLVLGDGPMMRFLEERARELGVADSVFLLGSRSHQEVALWMNVADCLCLPSRSEGMPNVVLEALASGLPVVATDVGAVRELLEGEPEAKVVEAKEQEKRGGGEALPISIAEALADMLARPGDRRKISQRGCARGSWHAQATKILELLSDP
jgi:glycosyltransferase involved in cell wall biosynthesis